MLPKTIVDVAINSNDSITLRKSNQIHHTKGLNVILLLTDKEVSTFDPQRLARALAGLQPLSSPSSFPGTVADRKARLT